MALALTGSFLYFHQNGKQKYQTVRLRGKPFVVFFWEGGDGSKCKRGKDRQGLFVNTFATVQATRT